MVLQVVELIERIKLLHSFQSKLLLNDKGERQDLSDNICWDQGRYTQNINRQRERERELDRQTERQTDTDRQRDTQTERETEIRQTDTQTERQTERLKGKQTHIYLSEQKGKLIEIPQLKKKNYTKKCHTITNCLLT